MVNGFRKSNSPVWPTFLLSVTLGLGLLSCAEPDVLTPSSYTIHVPDGFTVEKVAGPELLDYPMFAILDETGRLFVFESTGNVYETSQEAIDHPRFRIKLLEDANEDGVYDKSTVFADSLSFPQGGVFYRGSLYASSAPDLLKLTDTNGDGIADEREVLLSGWILNVNANSLIGPFMGPDGWLYLTSAIEGFDVTSKEGERLQGETARIWRVRPDGTGLEWVSAGGMNNPVELAFTGAGEVIGTQTFFVYPQRGLRDALTFWVEGGTYGKKAGNIARDGLTLTGDVMPVVSQYSRVAPAGLGVYRSPAFGEDFRDNLFSAQFNTHRVIRHRLFRDGASFRTEDEPFLWTDDADFHPTDVLEDADGSLLVVDTGGWFILGCPLSQVSKPMLKGGIYRVRRRDAAAIADPYGNRISWDSLEPAGAVVYLEDPRPFVADRAVQHLVDRGTSSVDVLAEFLRTTDFPALRTRAVFALYRIGTSAAFASVRSALADEDEEVRVAAARAMGLARGREAVDALARMAGEDQPAVRRQAATALGQIGDVGATQALLEAAASTDDRFIRHALIYAIVTLNRPEQIARGLEHASPEVRRAALIALDQAAGSPVQADQLTPFLESGEPALQQTALWVASHHPEWSKAITGYLAPRLEVLPQAEGETALIRQILVSYCGAPDMQRFVSDRLDDGDRATRLFMLDAMSDCRQAEFPAIWRDRLAAELSSSTDPEILQKIVELIRMHRLSALRGELARVANDEEQAASLRISAVGALLEFERALSDSHFDYLYDRLLAESEAPLLLQAAATLDLAELTEDQLARIAREYLPLANDFVLPGLAPLFQGAHELQTGLALVDRLMDAPSLDNFTEENLTAVFAGYPPEIRPRVDQLLEKLNEVRAERSERLTTLEAAIAAGDEARGRALYFGKATCWTCHTIGDEGGDLGPDLTSIQQDRSAHDILEAIVYPGVSFVRDFETYQVTTGTNRMTGIIKEQSPQAIVLATGPQTSIRIPREEILRIENIDVSLMPLGLDRLMTPQEFADLMAYLMAEDLIY